MNIDKNKVIKALSVLAIVFIAVIGLSKMLQNNSLTLTEYAEQNPPIMGTDESNLSTEPEEAASDQLPATGDEFSNDTEIALENEESSPSQVESGNMESQAEADAVPASTLTGAVLNGENMVEQRTTLADAFYYEPLSDNLKRYITGISFPTVTQTTENEPNADSLSETAEPVNAETDLALSYEELRYVHILHYDFDGNVAEGELICNEYIAQDLVEIFYELYRNEYRLEKVLLIDEYNGDDTASMEDNNTSCFNYRVVAGSSSLSKHALGLAIDINPLYNPYITYNEDGSENISPAGSEAYADRDLSFPYKIDEDDLCYKLFMDHGFIWGGNWNSCKDYQHFQKVME